jgi:Flp pilus assembly protein TadG
MMKWTRGRRPKSGESGQALVEFAFVSVIFVLLLFAIVDFGVAFFNDITLTNAAREGARQGAVQAGEDVIIARVQETADPRVNCDPVDVTVTNAQGAWGDSVVVEASCEYGFITPLGNIIGLITGGSVSDSVTVSSEANMRLE